ncbi:uncharacterized protein LOC134238194 [Saccostrea cucullata]|uniref:uncharacterized protein LOC134238194 n=1 Tax=Saccostrea cuccullata TaxID=36930 RepID=UPI002ED5B322
MKFNWCRYIFFVSLLYWPSIIMAICGILSPYWIKINASSDCFVGIINNVNCPENTKGLDSATKQLQITASIFMIPKIPFSVVAGLALQHHNNSFLLNCGICSLFVFLLYPITGILTFAGCMLILRDYPDLERGWSFYLCLAWFFETTPLPEMLPHEVIKLQYTKNFTV